MLLIIRMLDCTGLEAEDNNRPSLLQRLIGL